MKSWSRICKRLIFLFANVLAIATPFIFTGVNKELFEFNKIIFVYSLTILMVSCWLMRMIVRQQIIFKKSRLDIPLLLFLIAQTASTFFSIHPRTSFFGYYSRFHGGLLSTVAYSLIYWTLVNNLNSKQLKALLFTTTFSAVGVGLYALPERLFGVSLSCLILTNKAGTDCWIQDVQARVFATLGQPNWLAALLSMLLPIQIYFLLHPPKISQLIKLPATLKQIIDSLLFRRFLWLSGVVACMIALLFTQSRSGLLGFAAAMLFFTLGRFISIKKLKLRANAFLLCLLAGLVGLTFVVGTDFLPSINQYVNLDFFHLSQTQTTQQSSPDNSLSLKTQDAIDQGILISPSEDIRYVVWQGALNVWQRYPWLGSGPETFGYSYYLDRPLEHNLLSEWDFLYNKAHNEFLNLLANTGVIGLSSYLILMGACFFIVVKEAKVFSSNLDSRRSFNRSQVDMFLAFGASLVSFNATNFWGFSTVSVTIVWTLIMSYLGARHQKINHKLPHSQTISKSNSLQTLQSPPRNNNLSLEKEKSFKKRLGFFSYTTILCLFLVAFHLLFSLVTIWQADYHFAMGEALSDSNRYSKAIEYLQRAVLLSPKEAIFYDELANAYASAAVEFYEIEDVEAVEQFAQLAIEASDQALELNPHHFYLHQARASLFSKLSQVDDKYLEEARQTFITTSTLSPNHPKPIYHRALIEWIQDDIDQAIISLKKAIELKPNYHNARYNLGQIYESRNECDLAKEQYQYILDNIIPNDPNLLNKIEELEC